MSFSGWPKVRRSTSSRDRYLTKSLAFENSVHLLRRDARGGDTERLYFSPLILARALRAKGRTFGSASFCPAFVRPLIAALASGPNFSKASAALALTLGALSCSADVKAGMTSGAAVPTLPSALTAFSRTGISSALRLASPCANAEKRWIEGNQNLSKAFALLTLAYCEPPPLKLRRTR